MATPASNTKAAPGDAQVIISILKEMGVTEYEPRVVIQLLEFVYRYVTSVLDGAKVYAGHAKKKNIDLADIKLSVAMLMERSFTTPPPREILLEVARTKNSVPLPAIKPSCGLRLPPDRYCLTACNYRLHTIKKPTGRGAAQITLGASAMGHTGSTIRASVSRPTAAAKATVNPPAAASTPVPRFQIVLPSQPSATTEANPVTIEIKQETPAQVRGIKREREDDDYDAL